MQNQKVRLSLRSSFPAKALYHWQFISLTIFIMAFLLSGCGTSKAEVMVKNPGYSKSKNSDNNPNSNFAERFLVPIMYCGMSQ